MKFLKRYRFFIVSILALLFLLLLNHGLGWKALNLSMYSLKEMVLIIPPIFILLGLLDIWVPRETMVKYMGEKSGIKGIALSFLLGSATAGPLYGAFPVAAIFLKKGAKLTNVLIFIGAWSTTKIPMFLFELSSLGVKFALTRLLIDIPGIILIAFTLSRLLSKEEIKSIYENAKSL